MKSLCAAVSVAALATLDAQQTRPVFKSGVATVSVYATVRAQSGSLVTDLAQDDFEVRDNGTVRDITVFSREIVPITVTLLLDMSGSQEGSVEWMRDAAYTFVDELLPADRVRFGTFGAEVALSPRLTSDKTYLRRVISEEIWPGGSTPLWDAMDAAMSSLAKESGRRIILALTDGFDSTSGAVTPPPGSGSAATAGPTNAMGKPYASSMSSWPGTFALGRYGEILRRSMREEFMVYGVGKAVRPQEGGNYGGFSGQMMSLARESGGGFRIFAAAQDAKAAMAQVAEELHRQYLIGFAPAVIDNKVHSLEVKVKRSGMTVQARRNYLADGK